MMRELPPLIFALGVGIDFPALLHQHSRELGDCDRDLATWSTFAGWCRKVGPKSRIKVA